MAKCLDLDAIRAVMQGRLERAQRVGHFAWSDNWSKQELDHALSVARAEIRVCKKRLRELRRLEADRDERARRRMSWRIDAQTPA